MTDHRTHVSDPVSDPQPDPPPRRAARSSGPIRYKGEPLEAERGPGLGCFRFQLVVLAVFVALTPLSVVWRWPEAVSAGLLFAVILLLLVTGQTIIFLLRLVAADRRGRRRPLASATRTVGELEDEGPAGTLESDRAAGAHDRDLATEEPGDDGTAPERHDQPLPPEDA